MGGSVPWVATAGRGGRGFCMTVPSMLAHSPTESSQRGEGQRLLGPEMAATESSLQPPTTRPKADKGSPTPTAWVVPLHISWAIVAGVLAIL